MLKIKLILVMFCVLTACVSYEDISSVPYSVSDDGNRTSKVVYLDAETKLTSVCRLPPQRLVLRFESNAYEMYEAETPAICNAIASLGPQYERWGLCLSKTDQNYLGYFATIPGYGIRCNPLQVAPPKTKVETVR